MHDYLYTDVTRLATWDEMFVRTLFSNEFPGEPG